MLPTIEQPVQKLHPSTDDSLETICTTGMAQLKANFDTLFAALTTDEQVNMPGSYLSHEESLEDICVTVMAQLKTNFDTLFSALASA